jgi:predicted hydrolase (HD superfamily)
MLTRFELYVILRNQVADRGLRRRALAVEAAMEEMAGVVAGADPLVWGLAGLGANIDVARVVANPGRRGEMAAEFLATEGAPAEVVTAASARLGDVEAMDAMTAALVAAEALCEHVWDEIKGGEKLDRLDPRVIELRVKRQAEKHGHEAAVRVLLCLDRAGITLGRAAELVVAGMVRIKEDLKL